MSRRRRSKAELEWAVREIANALAEVGVDANVHNNKDAWEVLDLAAKCVSIVWGKDVTAQEVHEIMKSILRKEGMYHDNDNST